MHLVSTLSFNLGAVSLIDRDLAELLVLLWVREEDNALLILLLILFVVREFVRLNLFALSFIFASTSISLFSRVRVRSSSSKSFRSFMLR